jgi:catalase (peroxidase I)
MKCDNKKAISDLNKYIKVLSKDGASKELAATTEYRDMLVKSSYLQHIIIDGNRMNVKELIDATLDSDPRYKEALEEIDTLNQAIPHAYDKAYNSKLNKNVTPEQEAKGHIYNTTSVEVENIIVAKIAELEDRIDTINTRFKSIQKYLQQG